MKRKKEKKTYVSEAKNQYESCMISVSLTLSNHIKQNGILQEVLTAKFYHFTCEVEQFFSGTFVVSFIYLSPNLNQFAEFMQRTGKIQNLVVVLLMTLVCFPVTDTMGNTLHVT